MMEVVQRYIFDKKLEPFPDTPEGHAQLRAEVESFDEHFTHARIPTNRIKDVYLEAMAHHGPYLLKVDDYLRAWARIKPSEYAGVDLRPMGERGVGCSICNGTGYATVLDMRTGEDIVKECPYHCNVVMSLAKV